jgi:outer membrane lipoprotein-sorting protein
MKLVASLLVPALFATVLLSGCAQTSAGPVATSTPAVLNDVTTAKALIAEKRAALTGSVQQEELADPRVKSQLKPSETLAEFMKPRATETGKTLMVPDPNVVGGPSKAVMMGLAPNANIHRFQASAAYPDPAFTYFAFSDPTFMWSPSSDASYSATLVRYPARPGQPRFTRVTVRGAKGIALTRGDWASVAKGAAPAGITAIGSEVNWVEDGIYYQLGSNTLDPDQLLAIANTMVPVKP